MKAILLLFIPLAAVLTSCVSTPASRIQKNPAIYNRLSDKHQDLVRQGKIERGMTKPAVYLALGAPNSKTEGVQHGKRFERWNYNTLVPVYNYGFGPYYGYSHGYGYGCGYGGSYYGMGFYPNVYYEPRHAATVQFSRGKVTGWSRKQYR